MSKLELDLHGYRLSEMIAKNRSTIVYRGVRAEDNQPVILKMLKEEHVTIESVATLRNEYNILQSIHSAAVVKTVDFLNRGRETVLVTEDCGGVSLDIFLKMEGLTIRDLILICIRIVECIEEVHKHRIIHKDIQPANILIHPLTREVRLIDFGLATRLQPGHHGMKTVRELESGSSYMSPEQTGRMNRSLDYRTDFYSFGATAYEMLTGHPPFRAVDLLELVHAIMAVQPVSVIESNPQVPYALSAIIMKCLAKNAEDRYHSVSGLLADLQQCRLEMEETGTIQPFLLAQHDLSDRLHIPQKLYGRDHELAVLAETYQQVCNGKTRLVLIHGQAGVGKSALVQEFQKTLWPSRGRFISGKFDQYKQNIPYMSLIQAFQGLIRQLLAESKEELDVWRTLIREAVQGLGQVIVDVIPQLEMIIGIQPPAPELPPVEAKNRFQMVMQRFVRALARPDHPLILFLDDLQWADHATLQLVQQLITDMHVRHLLVIGAYRSDEVGSAHPLVLMQRELGSREGTLQEVTLEPLREWEINRMIAEMVHTDVRETIPLARLIVQKTEGNPFFAKEYVKTLHDRKLLRFSYAEKRWQWDFMEIEKFGTADNIVAFLVEKLRTLSAEEQRLLAYAACLGSTFTLEMIAAVYGISDAGALRKLWPAIMEGLVVSRQEEQYLAYVGLEFQSNRLHLQFSFVHDRLQQAAVSLLSDRERETVHLQIGTMMRSYFADTQRDEELFEMCDHLYQAKALINDQEEKARIAQLHLLAGKKAKASTAYDAAYTYLNQGAEMLPASAWEDNYPLAVELYTLQAEAAYLSNRFEEAERLFALVLGHAQTVLEQVAILEIKILMYTGLARFADVLAYAKQALRLLGVSLPKKIGMLDMLTEIGKIKRRMIGRSAGQLVQLPLMEDEHIKAAMRIISIAGPSSYFVEPNWFALTILRALTLSLERGNDVASPNGYTGYGIVLCSKFGDYRNGYLFGELACSIADQFADPLAQTKAYGAHALLINHWQNHARTNIPLLEKAIRHGVDSGSNIYMAYNMLGMLDAMFFCGDPMEDIQQQIQLYADVISQVKIVDHDDRLLLLEQTIHSLAKSHPDKPGFALHGFDEESYAGTVRDQENHFKRYMYHYYKIHLLYLFGQYQEAADLASEAEKWMESVRGQLLEPQHVFIQTLALTALYPSIHAAEQAAAAKKIRSNLKKVKTWAKHSPQNYKHRYQLLAAEWALVCGKKQKAAALYEQAIQQARHDGFVQNEGIACERAAAYSLSIGHETLAKYYINDAYHAYLRWGAAAKAKDLEERYPQLLYGSKGLDRKSRGGAEAPSSSVLDMMTVIRASQTIASEIKLDKLLETMLRTVISNAGAEKGLLILKKEKQWVIEAAGSVKHGVDMMQSMPYEQSGLLSVSIVNYAIRAGEMIVRRDAFTEEKYARDPYIKLHQPKSILCSPLWLQGKMIGIIYLENNLAADVFDEKRIELLQMIFAQIAIFIENARLYHQLEAWNHSLEKTVADRTDEIQRLLRDNKNLLDHAGQGFLLFSRDQTVHSQYSRECLRIFGKEISGFPVAELLYPDRPEDQVFVQQLLDKYFETQSSSEKELYLSLLPTEVVVNHMPIKVESKPIFDTKGDSTEKLMMVLTDLSEKRALESKMEKEWQTLKMVVTVVTNLGMFHEAVQELSTFCEHHQEQADSHEALIKVLGRLHTFKGEFSQLQMIHTTQILQELETAFVERIKEREQLKVVPDMTAVQKALQQDIAILQQILGSGILEPKERIVSFAENRWEAFETKLKAYLQEQGRHELLHDVKQLHYRPFRELLTRYPDYVGRIAERFGKKIAPLSVDGGHMLVDSSCFAEFAESLVHVFRNAVDHGLEDDSTRLSQNKNTYGTITCSIAQIGQEIVVTISDDGKGIDIEAIKAKAYRSGLLKESAEKWSDQEWMAMIFTDVFSTKEEIGELSGLGMGLSIVKEAVDRLGGRIEIRSSKHEGTAFLFYLPWQS
ncbi:AAA family ATPase [Brevibacillus migulae]|uniref:AAA family ATPase n=1 Tax=Brevibacillus migulae TaxID=1644114 RepID=UPI00106E7CC8|nr:AAA family ATPase [Brevibacillus migulae]